MRLSEMKVGTSARIKAVKKDIARVKTFMRQIEQSQAQ